VNGGQTQFFGKPEQDAGETGLAPLPKRNLTDSIA
jgi:hypothetical protein